MKHLEAIILAVAVTVALTFALIPVFSHAPWEPSIMPHSESTTQRDFVQKCYDLMTQWYEAEEDSAEEQQISDKMDDELCFF